MKNNFLKMSAVLIGAFAISNSALALDEIMKNYRGIRSLGMGGVTFTTGVYDEALFANPAMHAENPGKKWTILDLTLEGNGNLLGDTKKLSEAVSASGTAVITKMSETLFGRNEHGRLTLMLPAYYNPTAFGEKTAFSFGFILNSQFNVMLRSNAAIQAQALVDAGPNFGVAHKLLDDTLDVGINLHTLYRVGTSQELLATEFIAGKKLKLDDFAGQGIGIDFDLGTYYKIPVDMKVVKLSVGGSINNVLQSLYRFGNYQPVSKIKGSVPPNDRTLNMGVRGDFKDFAMFRDSLWAFEVQNIGTTRSRASFWKKIHTGGETKLEYLNKLIALRFGLNQGYVGGGVGFDLPVVSVDFATYGEEIGAVAGQLEDRRYALRLGFHI